jgi:sugar lactone lactonase YvrE
MRDPVNTDLEVVPDKVRQFLGGQDRGKPFYLSISFRGPKDPWGDCPSEVAGKYKGTAMPVPATANQESAQRQPDFIRSSMAAREGQILLGDPQKLSAETSDYYRSISTVDAAVGRLRRVLAEQGYADNTVILFASDNGMMVGDHGLRGKWLPHEASIRIPLIVHDPRSGSDRRGVACNEMVLNIDWAPTLLSLAGCTVPAQMQGRDLSPLLRGEKISWRTDFYYEHSWTAEGRIPASEAVRGLDWKLVRYPGIEPPVEQLFHLSEDPEELRNVIGETENLEPLNRLRARMDMLRREAARVPEGGVGRVPVLRRKHTIHEKSPFERVGVADFNGDGELEMVAGKGVATHAVDVGATDAPYMGLLKFEREKGVGVTSPVYEGIPAEGAPEDPDKGEAMRGFESGSAGAGLQSAVRDMDRDKDVESVTERKTKLEWSENPRIAEGPASLEHSLVPVAEAHYSFGCAVAGNGQVLFTEFNHRLIQCWDPVTGRTDPWRILRTPGMYGVATSDMGGVFVGLDLGDLGNPGKVLRISQDGTDHDVVLGITRPRQMTCDRNGNLFVALEGGRVLRWDRTTQRTTELMTARTPVGGIAVGPDGSVYVSEYGQFRHMPEGYSRPEEPGVVKVRRPDGTVHVLAEGFWRARGIALQGSSLYLCTEADREDHGNSGLLVRLDTLTGQQETCVDRMDYPQFPAADVQGCVYFTLGRDNKLVAYHPAPFRASINPVPSVKKAVVRGGHIEWGAMGRPTCFLLESQSLRLEGAFQLEKDASSIEGYIEVPADRFELNPKPLYEVFDSEHPAPGIFELPAVRTKVGSGSLTLHVLPLRRHQGKRWPMRNVGTVNEAPAEGFSEQPEAFRFHFTWKPAMEPQNPRSQSHVSNPKPENN